MAKHLVLLLVIFAAGCGGSKAPGTSDASMVAPTCAAGLTACDGGCVDTTQDIHNCGDCGEACDLPNATPACMAGSCVISACSPGFEDCNHTDWDGCEANLSIDQQNCGQCNISCHLPNAQVACVSGECEFDGCNRGFAQCLPDGGMPPDGGIRDAGCETNVSSDLGNCGGCGVQCTVFRGNPVCVQGQCTVGSCDPGYGNCDGVASTGCETNLNTDPANCGACNTPCNVPNASANCIGGSCELNACDTGYADCNKRPSDGCEINTMTDQNNCGTCGHICPNGCFNGQCN